MPGSDKMCSLRSRQPGVVYVLQKACSILGLHVRQLDHINLIFKLQHALPTTPCKLFRWGGGECVRCEERAPRGMHIGRMPGAAMEVSAATGNAWPSCL